MTDYRQGAFCALGGIALQGIHQAKVIPGETVKLISKENKTITGKIFDFYEGQIVLTCENIFEPDGGFEYCLNDIKSIEKVSEKE